MAFMPIGHTQVISFPVSDQDRALDFSVSAVGFELLSDTAMPGIRRTMDGYGLVLQ